jgi:hypothetical protein
MRDSRFTHAIDPSNAKIIGRGCGEEKRGAAKGVRVVSGMMRSEKEVRGEVRREELRGES